MKKEIKILVEPAPDRGLRAWALSKSIYTEAGNLRVLPEQIHDAAECYFEEAEKIELITISLNSIGITTS